VVEKYQLEDQSDEEEQKEEEDLIEGDGKYANKMNMIKNIMHESTADHKKK
jgi:hypothetical protein